MDESFLFLTELKTDADDHFSSGRNNNILDISLTVFVVSASLIAAGLAAAELQGWWKSLTVVFAAMPAAVTSVQARLRVRELSTWYFRYSTALRGIERELRYSNKVDITEIVARRNKIDEAFEAQWFELKTRPESPDSGK
jgi:hypothetical protein